MDEQANQLSEDAAHRIEACEKMSPIGQKLFKYVEFDKNEEMLAEIRKHPIGVVVIAVIGVVVSLFIAASASFLASNTDSFGFSGSSSSKSGILAVGFILAIIALAITAISIVLYRSNVVYITNQKVAHVAYVGIFNRKVTQLGMGNVEDVAVKQNNIFARLFNFGINIVETAGEKENLTFTMVPRPNTYSQIIIEAHEKYVEKYGN